METPPLLLALDLVGVFFFALSGNLLAARKNIDITGGLVLGLLAGLGGGLVRDVLLGVTPLTLSEPVYLVPPFLAAAVVYLIGPYLHRVRLLIVGFDAGGLGLFCTFGTVRALDHGMPVASALLLGVITAAGGVVVDRLAVLAEGGAKDRTDIKFLAPLPLFNADGSVK